MCSDKCPKPEEGSEPSESIRCYDWVKFKWPALQPQRLVTDHLFDAGKRRWWKIANEWYVKIDRTKKKGFNGIIVIPEGTCVDGASVPLPWLVSPLDFWIPPSHRHSAHSFDRA